MAILIAGGVGRTTHAATITPGGRSVTPRVPHVLYIMFKPNAAHLRMTMAGNALQLVGDGNSQFAQVLSSIEATAITPFDAARGYDSAAKASGIDRIFVVHWSNEIAPEQVMKMFLNVDEIEGASPRYLFPLLKTPNDPKINQQYALSKLKMFNAWDITTGDTNVVIADVDEGTNYNHEDLAHNIKYNKGEVGLDKNGHDKRTNGIDDDGDGVVDNWLGVDIIGTGTPGQYHSTGDPIPGGPSFNHGTITAGCIAAVGDNGLGIAGTAYNGRLMLVRADDGQGHIAAGYDGIYYAIQHGARVINCSWGGPIDSASVVILGSLVKYATASNALIVAASGNSGINIDDSLFAPASLPGVLAVGATDQDDQPASFSNYGKRVDVFAPGVAILSTTWPGNDQYTSEDGTSFASPLVAGIASLVMGQHPTWPPKFVAKQLVVTCDNVVKPSDRTHYWGRVNAQAAVATPTFPGLVVASHTVNGSAKGLLDTVGTASTISVSFQNIVGAGQNLVVDLLPTLGATVDQPHQVIGSMNGGDTRQLNFTLHRTTQYSSGLLPLSFAVSDGQSYSDTLSFNVPMQLQSGLSYVDSANGYCTSVKQIDPGTGWFVLGFDNGTNVLSYYEVETDTSWTFGGNLGDGKAAPWCIDAVDGLTAWAGTASLNGKAHPKVYYTVDGGGSWTGVDVIGITPYVNSIRFVDATHGMFIGDPHSGNWGIGISVDGGQTWKASTSPVAALGGEVGWKNSISWVRNNGWFGTNKGEIYKTVDGGIHWTAHPIAASNCVGLGFADDSLHGFAVCRKTVKTLTGTPAGANGFFRTVDGGNTWTAATLPGTNNTASDVKFIPGMDDAIVLTDQGVYRTPDFGSHWTIIGAPIAWSGTEGYLSIGVDAKSFVATAVSSLGSVSVGGPVPPRQKVDSQPEAIGAQLYQSSPNPATDRTTLRYSLSARERISLEVYDAVGRRIATLASGIESPGVHAASFETDQVPSGVYEYVLTTGSGLRLVRRLTVVR